LRWERQKAAQEAAQGAPQRQCKLCGCKFASRKTMKRHRCPLSKEVSSKVGMDVAKGKTVAPPKPNKLAPKKTPPAPSAPHPTPNPTEALVAVAAHPPPVSALEAAKWVGLPATLHGMVWDPTQPSAQLSGLR
jgi:hypothetical protein